jgi:signal transduction histidine kinase
LKLWDEFVETLVTIKSGGESPDQYLCDLVQRIIEELGCDTGSITMYDPNDGALHYQRFLLREGTEDQKRQYEDKARNTPRPIGSGRSLVGEAYATRKIVNWPDMKSLEYQRRYGVQSIHPDARAWLAVPILFGDNCYGVMAWTSFSPGYFTEHDEKTVQRAAKLGALYLFVRSLLQEKDNLLQEKDNFMATISHQLVAPLTSLEESCSQLLDSDLPANIRRQLLTDVHDAATLALHIAHNYKSVRRWLQTSEELHVATIPVDLAGLVASIADLFRPIAYKNPISVEYPPASQALHVLGDENLLKHILINLMDNAVKYSNPNTDIQVRLERSEEGYGVVRIHNIGPFIDEQERKQIFNFGYRGASARNRNSAGTGIGLTVAEAITQAHHGRLSVDSCVRNEKKGEADIEFILKIPLDSTQ